MKKGFLILLLVFCLQAMAFTAGLVNLDIVAGNWHVLYWNPGGKLANDFHICGIVESEDNYQPKLQSHAEFVVGGGGPDWYLEEFTIEKVANHPKNWYFTAHFKTDGFISSGTMMHFGLLFYTNYCNKAVVNCAYWTNFKEAVGRMPLISFHVYKNANGINIINLINTAEVPLVLNNLELAVIPRPIPLEEMYTAGLGNPGQVNADQYKDVKWVALDRVIGKELVIKPGANIELALQEAAGMDLKAEQYLIIRGYTVYQNVRVPWWIQHEESTK